MLEELIALLREKPRTREELCERLGMADPSVRRLIGEARQSGFPIVSSSHSKGYKLGTKEELMKTAYEYQHRADRCMEMAQCLAEMAGELRP